MSAHLFGWIHASYPKTCICLGWKRTRSNQFLKVHGKRKCLAFFHTKRWRYGDDIVVRQCFTGSYLQAKSFKGKTLHWQRIWCKWAKNIYYQCSVKRTRQPEICYVGSCYHCSSGNCSGSRMEIRRVHRSRWCLQIPCSLAFDSSNCLSNNGKKTI